MLARPVRWFWQLEGSRYPAILLESERLQRGRVFIAGERCGQLLRQPPPGVPRLMSLRVHAVWAVHQLAIELASFFQTELRAPQRVVVIGEKSGNGEFNF